jgi:type I restriction enzyme S subunit
MKSEWKECQLGDLITFQRGHDLPKTKMQGGNYPVVGSNGIIGYHNEYTTESPSITIGRSGNVGKPFLYNGKSWSHNTSLYIKEYKNVDPIFIYYFLQTLDLGNYAGGSAVPTLNRNHIHTLNVCVPMASEEQKQIASILSSLDDKIMLNTAINENLLQQAVAIFDNAIEQSEHISHAELGSLADVKGGKRLPKGVNLITTPNLHPYIRVRDLNDVVFASLSANYEYVDDETQKTISRYITSTGDVLISIVGTIGLTAIVDKSLDKANLTENCVKITNLRGVSPEYLILFLRSQNGVKEIQKGTVGAVQAKLPIKNIQSINIPLLPQSEMQSLSDTLTTLFSQISMNTAESKCLAGIRDSLLPQLMNGKIDVSKVKI